MVFHPRLEISQKQENTKRHTTKKTAEFRLFVGVLT
jgi:hypothetical protein